MNGRIATLMVHTSPLDQPGIGDAGGMNIYVVEAAQRMAAMGVEVDIFTRRTNPQQAEIVELSKGVRVRHFACGHGALTKEELLGIIDRIYSKQKEEKDMSKLSDTIKAALDAQRAASVALETPSATGYLKNSGADLPPSEVSGLLASWNRARKNNGSTAYLTSTLEYQTIGFSPKDMAYQDAIQGLSTECARLCSVDPYYLSSSMNTSMTYSNVIEERKQLVALTLQPYVSAIESRLSMDDISTSGHYVKFSLDDTFLRTEPMERLLVLEKMLALGLITVEQAMEMENLTPNGNGN
jgi:hypothetical protein